MSTSRPTLLRVCFLPDSAGMSPAIVAGIASSGVLLVSPADADVALWDVREDLPGPQVLRLDLTPSLPVVALIPEGVRFESGLVSTHGVADFVSASASVGEIVARLWQARARQATKDQADQRDKDLQLLLKVTADYAGSLDVASLLHDVTRMLAESLDIERAAVVVLSEQPEVGYVIAASDDAALAHVRLDLSKYPEIREVVRTGAPVVVEDAPSHPLLEGVRAHVRARGIHGLAALPLAASGKVLGVLLVRASDKRAAFLQREIDFLATVAHSTGIALRNARILESVKGQTEREKHARIAAEEKAAELEHYESYFEHMSDGIAILGPDGHLLSLNPAGASLLEVHPERARGRHFRSLSTARDETRLEDTLKAVARGEIVRDVDVQIRTPGARLLTMSVSVAPLERADGAVIVAFRDVTMQRRMAEELATTKDFLERLIDSSADAIIAADVKGKIILFNKGAEEICGYTAYEALSSLHVRQLYAQGGAEDIMQRLRDPAVGGGKGRLRGVRLEIITRSGHRIPVSMTASIVYDGEREVATLGIFTDIRERMTLEKQLSAAKDRLGEAERSAVIVALAGTAAHELNQPLTSVLGYAELLRRRIAETDSLFRPVETIYREAERMAEIVRKIGKITRYETKAYVGESQILDLDKASSHED